MTAFKDYSTARILAVSPESHCTFHEKFILFDSVSLIFAVPSWKFHTLGQNWLDG
jgi:hypothetical protein